MSEAAEAAVKRGAEVLDQVEPQWREIVDAECLDMASGDYIPGRSCGCVIAQLDHHHDAREYGDDAAGSYRLVHVLGREQYMAVAREIAANGYDPDDWHVGPYLGFDVGGEISSYGELQQAWLEALR